MAKDKEGALNQYSATETVLKTLKVNPTPRELAFAAVTPRW
jgi:hypothetical protein